MAGRDEQPLEEPRRSPRWWETLNLASAVVLAGGVLLYGYLSICYDRFYGSLGVDPNDVGLSYTGTLARSSGFVIIFLIFFMILILEIPSIQRRIRGDPTVKATWGTAFWMALTILLLAWIVVLPGRAAEAAARKVEAGTPVQPQRLWLTLLAIHADPATVEPVGKPGDSPAAERLRGKKLLYLGQSEGTVLLYDATVQRAIYAPASSIVLQVTNCRAKRPPLPACETGGQRG